MEKDGSYRAWLLDLKEKLSMRRTATSRISFPVEVHKELGERELADKMKTLMVYMEKKQMAEISSLTDERCRNSDVENSFQVLPEEKYRDDVMMYRWMMCQTVHAAMSCIIGATVLFIAILFLYFAHEDPVSEETFKKLNYAIKLAFGALMSNSMMTVYLICFSFTDDCYHERASDLIGQIYELLRCLMEVESSLGDDNEDISQELHDIMGPFMGGTLYDILHFGFTAKADVTETIKRIEPLVQKASLEEASPVECEFPPTPDLPEVAMKSTSAKEQERPEDLIEQLHERLRRIKEIVKSSSIMSDE